MTTRIDQLTSTRPRTIIETIEACAEIVAERALIDSDDTRLEFAAELLTDFMFLTMAQAESWEPVQRREFMQDRDCGDESDAQR